MSIKFERNEEGEIFSSEEEVLLNKENAREYIKEKVIATAEELLTGEDYLKVIRETLIKELRGSTKIKEEAFEKNLIRYDIKLDEIERRLNKKETALIRLEAEINTQADKLEQYEGIIKEKEKELKDIGNSFSKANKYARRLDEIGELVKAFNVLVSSNIKEEIELLEG